MKNILSDLQYFVLGFVAAGLILLSSFAHATHENAGTHIWVKGLVRGDWAPTETAACATLGVKQHLISGITWEPQSIVFNTGTVCSVIFSHFNTITQTQLSDSQESFDRATIPPCNPGEGHDHTDGICVPVVTEQCPDGTFTGHIDAASSPSVVCVNGCPANIVSASNQIAVGGVQVIAGTWVYEGGDKPPSCTGAIATAGVLEEINEAPACKPSECLGQVNGQWVCSACSVAATPNTTYDVGETSTVDSSGTSVVEQSQETKLGPEGVTQITNITSTDPEGVQTTQTVTEIFSQNKFCENNPKSNICEGAKDPCAENPDSLACIELGDPVDTETVGETSIGVSSLTPVVIAGNSSCPPDVPLPKGMSFSWQGICDGAGMMNPIVLALAWLGAGFIMIGGLKGE